MARVPAPPVATESSPTSPAPGVAAPCEQRPDDHAAVLARLAGEPAAVRDSIGLFAILVFLVGDRNDHGDHLVAAITEGIGLSEDDIERLMPHGRLALESVAVTPPASDWARQVCLELLCGVARTSTPVTAGQLQVLGRLGEAYGVDPQALTRILAAELGISPASATT
ncbi:MAG: hypothetical protein IPO88_30925 [Nannocystis sp.]|uniref:hypothetical protein n=1 Tax=Nannocystis sp. TaxID=1962667 RepID=UPI002424F93A|nr:hypothetical protein [Nannocystis sp.]MBK9757847.1 hypothetical protein [Nannocystis sp.]